MLGGNGIAIERGIVQPGELFVHFAARYLGQIRVLREYTLQDVQHLSDLVCVAAEVERAIALVLA